MINSLQFKCSNCSGTVLEEVHKHATVTYTISRLVVDGNHEYGEPKIFDTTADGYRCTLCGAIVKGEGCKRIDNSLDLVNWLKKQKYDANNIR